MAKTRGKNEQLESYELPELHEALAQFFAELRKENGKDYEPDSLKVMQAALDRDFRSKHYPKSIVSDTEFLSSRKVLEEHHDMKVEDFSFQRDDGGVELVTFSEGLTKTRGGGL